MSYARRHNNLGLFLLSLLVLTQPIAGRADSVADALEIGHLETTEDTGINWQYWVCRKTGETLHCRIFQTLINHQIERDDKQAYVDKRIRESSVAAFRRVNQTLCEHIPDIRNEARQQIAVNKEITTQASLDLRTYVDLLDAACRNPTTESIRNLFQHEADQGARTCIVTNMSSEDTLHWNTTMKTWESRSQESGPCGEVTETRLSRDPNTFNFWRMEERHIYTKRDARLPTGTSCSLFPSEKTYHFTWAASESTAECTYLKNRM